MTGRETRRGIHRTPRTQLCWSSLPEWIDAAWELESRRSSTANTERKRLHVEALPSTLIARTSDKAALEACRSLLTSGPSGFTQPLRGQRADAPHTALIVAINNRLAGLDRFDSCSAKRPSKGRFPVQFRTQQHWRKIMELKHIELDQLKPASVNVRKKGAKDVSDLVPSIKALGLLQPLLVRPNCEGYEIVAGQRRYFALAKIAEDEAVEPVPCIVMEEGDDAKAIEASLAENVARLPMDEIDQMKAFAALVKEGRSINEIASHFGVTERLVKQRLALANIHGPILTAYRKGEVGAETLRILTMASKRQQKAWWALFTDEEEYAPTGYLLREWLFGGADIPVENALFDLADYDGSIVADLFGEERYFDDAKKFWALQNTAIATLKDDYLAKGWAEVEVLEVGKCWGSWDYVKAAKKDGGRVYIQIASDGEVTCREGLIPEKEARKRAKAGCKDGSGPVAKPELTKAMQNYLDLHRHAAVRAELLSHSGIALRLAVAQIIAGSELWTVRPDPQRANTKVIRESVTANKAEDLFAKERQAIRELLGIAEDDDETIVSDGSSYEASHDATAIFAKLVDLDDETVLRILTFVVAETLPCGHTLIEALGQLLSVDMAKNWQPDDTFFKLLRDKATINAIVREIAGKATADAHISSTAKVQKKIIRDCLDGTRKPHKADWYPRYLAFPMRAYTKQGGIDAIDRWQQVKKLFPAA